MFGCNTVPADRTSSILATASEKVNKGKNNETN